MSYFLVGIGPIPGREGTSAAHFQEFVQYVGGLQQTGDQIIRSRAPRSSRRRPERVLPDSRRTAKLDAVIASDAWQTHMTRAGMHLEGLGVIRGATGELVMERMALWSKLIPA